MKDAIQELQDFVRTCSGVFGLADVEPYFDELEVPEQVPFPEVASGLLEELGLAFTLPDEATFLPQAVAFKDAKFLIKPTADEVAQGILIPGHRFLPFGSIDLFPTKACLLLPDGRPAPMRKVALPAEDCWIYTTLLGSGMGAAYFCLDEEVNEKAFETPGPPTGEFSLSAFDLSEFNQTCGFAESDYLLVTVKDWWEGVYAVEHAPASHLQNRFSDVRRWCMLLEESLLGIFEYLGPRTTIRSQLAAALYHGNPRLIEDPGLHFGGFLAQSKKVAIAPMGGDTVLWYEGEDPAEELLGAMEEQFAGAPMTGTTESLTSILQDVGLASSEVEVRAYMLDGLYQGVTDLRLVLARFLAGRISVDFATPVQAEAYHRYMRELWEALQSTYNPFTDKEIGLLRARVVRLVESAMRFLRELDDRGIGPGLLPANAMMEFAKTQAQATWLLELLNDPEHCPPEELRHLRKSLGSFEAIFHDQTRVLQEWVDELPDDTLSLSEPTPQVYQLKITLKDSKPPIWRRIQVPDVALDELHHIILAAMGWAGGHLHVFEIDDENFGEDDEELDFHDESMVRLSDFDLTEKSRFTYEYDFGDSWLHQVLVEKVLAPEEGVELPRCLTGRRARPPEDCGGIWGYEELLESLADPEHPNHEDAMEWCGPLDPETFDKQVVNRRFAALSRTL